MGVIVFVTIFYQVALGDCRGLDESLTEDYLTDVFLIFLKCFHDNNVKTNILTCAACLELKPISDFGMVTGVVLLLAINEVDNC